MEWLWRLLILVPVVFGLSLVYAGQRHDNVPDTLHEAKRLTFKGVVSVVLIVLIMQLLQALFID